MANTSKFRETAKKNSSRGKAKVIDETGYLSPEAIALAKKFQEENKKKKKTK